MQVETRGGAPNETPSTPFKIEYDPALPITAHRAEVIEAIRRHPVLVLCGATGSGKSTQLPKLCLEAGRGLTGVIGHTQPRRIAARALASRLAEETGTTVGGAIGYKVRFNDRTGPSCRVKLMTDGILLKELESDRRLRRYDTLIIDEAHERSLNIDLLLGVLKQLLPQRPDLRLIVTSATIDPGKFADFFGGAPIIEVSGRSYPVEVRYRPLIFRGDGAESDAAAASLAAASAPTGSARSASADEQADIEELSLPEGILQAVRELDTPGRGGFGQGSRGDVLVFLPGEKQIREAADALEKARLPNTEVLPLFARLSSADQERIFQRHSQRRVVLATNVAETSLTVPGIRFVIDSGLARISRYSVRGKVQRLPIERISKASADQRKGRCGREAEGICIRLYSEEDFDAREDFTPPEVLRTNLASVILRMAALGLGDPESFPFLDPPDTRLVNDGVRLLQELKAMDAERRVTSLGQQIAGIPVDPRLGRMLLAASRQHCLTEMLVVAAFLEVQDPRERPTDAQQQASEKHALFADARSDFVTVLNVWRAFNEQSAALSRNQLRKWCREHFLSFMRMREWQDLHGQLVQSLAELKLRANQMPASYTDLHQAILTGFLGSIGELDEKREYNGPRGVRFVIAPGTPLAAKPPRWIVAGSIVETTRLYARMVAAVDPGWIEAAGAHLLKRSYSEPHWVHTRGFVSAYESVALYGLTLAARRRVNYGSIAPAEARDIFIREALVESGSGSSPPPDTAYVAVRGGGKRVRASTAAASVDGDFLEANRRLQAQVEAIEAKIRRRDVLVDEESLVQFYAARIPERVNSVAAFNHWRVQEERSTPRLLYMSQADLMKREAPEAGPELFPDELAVGGNALPLIYKFEPAESADGVTLILPEPLLDVVNGEQIPWLVPGMRLEKVTAMFRALPKSQRKLLVPVPDYARAALEDLAREESRLGRLPGFHEWLAQWVTQRVGAPVSAAELGVLAVPDHLRMNLRVLDAEDRVIAEGRDLLAIKRRVYGGGERALGGGGAPYGVGLVGAAGDGLRHEPGSDEGAGARGAAGGRALGGAGASGAGPGAGAGAGAGLSAGDDLRGGADRRGGRDRSGRVGASGVDHSRGVAEWHRSGDRSDRGGAGGDPAARGWAGSGGGGGSGGPAGSPNGGAHSRGTADRSDRGGSGGDPAARGRAGSGARGGLGGPAVSGSGGAHPRGGADRSGRVGASGVDHSRGAAERDGGAGPSGHVGPGAGAGARHRAGAGAGAGSGAGTESGGRAGSGGGGGSVGAVGRGGSGSSRAGAVLGATPGGLGGGAGRGGRAGPGGRVASSVGAGQSGGPGALGGAGPRSDVGASGGLGSGPGVGAGLGVGVGIRDARSGTGCGGGAAGGEVLHKQWDFGDLPESRQVERNRLKLVVYPALADRGTGVALVEARNAYVAEAVSRAGMVRLAMLVLPQQAKYVSKRMADDRDLVLLSRGVSLQQALADALTQRTFRECFFRTDAPLPRDAQSFSRRLDEHRAQLSDVADRLAGTVTSIFREWRAVRSGLDSLRPGSFADAVGDIEGQLRILLPPDFIESTQQPWLDSLPRYLKAIVRRVERLRSNERRDAELAAKVKPFSSALRALLAEPALNGSRAEIDQLRWMIEEFRVSLFAQDLKTVLRVSEKRLAEQLAAARDSQR